MMRNDDGTMFVYDTFLEGFLLLPRSQDKFKEAMLNEFVVCLAFQPSVLKLSTIDGSSDIDTISMPSTVFTVSGRYSR